MRWAHAFRLRLRGALHRRRLDRDLDEELRFHLEMKARDHRESGLQPDRARERASKQFGNATLFKEISRDMFGFGSLEILLQDLRYGLRTLLNNPGFTASIVLTLALGIGANTAIFSVINAVMLRSLPVRAPGELVVVGDPSDVGTLTNGASNGDIFSYPLYRQVREQNQFFTDVLASGRTGRLEVGAGGGDTVKGRLVSGNYFEVLGVRPSLGRVFTAGEDRVAGEHPVVVVSHNYWRTVLAADPNVPGRQLTINGSKFTIVGVGPPGFFGDIVGVSSDVWIPLTMQGQVNPGSSYLEKNDASWLLLIGRLKPGVTIAQARAGLNLLIQNLQIELEGSSITPASTKKIRQIKVPVNPGGKGFSYLRRQFSQPLIILMVLVALVLLIACSNVANLLLARATSRQKEISMRLALGAGRLRLLRQLLTESLLLASLGGIAGLLLAWWGASLLLWLASDSATPLPLDVRPDPLVLSFVASVTLITGLLFGLAPALRSTRQDFTPALRERSQILAHGRRRFSLGQTLVIVQIALSLLMLVGAGLFAATLHHLQTMDVGYQRDGLMMIELDPVGSGYRQSQILPFCRNLLARLQAMPGVDAVSVSENGVFSGTESITGSLSAEGFTPSREQDREARSDQVGPHYFRTVGITLLQGRDLNESDAGPAPPVAVVNETLANFYWPHSNPVGRHFTIGRKKPVTYTVVGVSHNAQDHALTDQPVRRFYTPLLQATSPIADFNFEIRTRQNAQAIRKTVREFDRNLKIQSIQPVGELIDSTIGDERLIAQLSVGLAALALLLAATGLYGVMAYATSRRAAEIGLRMALGADRSRVIWMVLREALWLSLLGVALGVPAALAAAQLVEHSVVGLSTADPLVFSSSSAVLIAAALLAGFFPAAKASRIDPMIALRQQ